MAKHSSFIIFTDDGERHTVTAPSLRRALRDCGIDERKTRIVAAVEAGCLPRPAAEGRPFFAIMLKNPAFNPPEEP